jgi:hypothetical protein
MVNNSTNINKTPQISEHKKTMTHVIGNPGPGLMQTQNELPVEKVLLLM